MFSKVRKTRSDCTVDTYEKKHDLPTGTIRNTDGRKARKDKKLATLRKETGRISAENLLLETRHPPKDVPGRRHATMFSDNI